MLCKIRTYYEFVVISRIRYRTQLHNLKEGI